MSRIAIACALCLLLAGCAAPTARPTTVGPDSPAPNGSVTEESAGTGTEVVTTEPTERPADGGDIPVSGGSLPVDHERVFARTAGLLGADVPGPTIIVVKPAAEIRAATGGPPTPADGSGPRSFAGVMGIGSSGGEDDEEGSGNTGESDDSGTGDGENGVSVAAYAPSATSVVVNERVAATEYERALERTLAHEFVHTVQFRQDALARTQRALGVRRSLTRDTYLTFVSVIEGVAAFVADAYDRRYLPGDSASITTTERYRSATAGVKYSIARYYFGVRYLRHRFDSPRNVSAVYDDPPRTTEQLLHNDTDGSEEPRPLALSVRAGGNRTVGATDTYGELFARIALSSELNATTAADAAAGWGTDRLAPVAGENGTRSFVWATRWDAPAEADEFAAGAREYLDARAARSASTADAPAVWRDGALAFRVVRVSDETVVLLAGTESFVRDASVAGTNASASVTVGNDG